MVESSVPKTLVYVGANVGLSLQRVVHEFDKVFAFEPDPEIFESLTRRCQKYPWVQTINAACAEEDGTAKFYVYPNRVSSSLSFIAEGIPGEDLHPITIEVQTVNLLEFLISNQVENIDSYVSDCQGSDLKILNTIKPLIEEKRIREIFVETHNSDIHLYDGLENGFNGFKELLSPNYEFVAAFLGRLDNKQVAEAEIPSDEYEWDTQWKVKET